MAAPDPASRLSLEVLWRLDGTTKTDTYTAERVSVTRFRDGSIFVELVDGADSRGPVRDASYERSYRTVTRPAANDPARVEEARQRYRKGIAMSPGREPER